MPDQRGVMRGVLKLFKKNLKSDPSHASQIAKALFTMAVYKDMIEDRELRAIGSWAWDQIDLAEQGVVSDTLEQIIAKICDGIDHALASPWLAEI
jgi:hypothetical protein